MKIILLLGSSSTNTFIMAIISFVIINLIFDFLFCLNSVRWNLSAHGSYQRVILQEIEVNWAKLFEAKKKKGEKKKEKATILHWKVFFILYSILWHLYGTVRADFSLL